ncbi:MAG TPA: thioredoxin domain-containing protein [Candidatus Binatus sp.]|uniref:DsbA family protein n=1 Tax=Candidatus Binatus sp. TaxID=2811406 RepID=UPI002F421A31
MRNRISLTVAGIIGAMMLTSLAALAGPHSANVMLAQDDWVRLPSSGGNSDSEPPTRSTSQDAKPVADHPQRGGDNAAVTIVEYSDFQCPYCRAVEASLRQVMKKYGDQVRLVYMDFPLAFHQHAIEAAMAARCADEQGQFWTYHDALIENRSALSTPGLKSTAEQLGLDSLTFDRCLDGRKYESSVIADRTQGERVGAHGTPYFIVGNRSMSGAQPASAFQAAIDEQLRSR